MLGKVLRYVWRNTVCLKERNVWQFCADRGKLFHSVIVCGKMKTDRHSCVLLAFHVTGCLFTW